MLNADWFLFQLIVKAQATTASRIHVCMSLVTVVY